MSILRSLGERRILRAARKNCPSTVWDALENGVFRASTILWETPPMPTPRGDLCDDLLAYCAYLAREIEVTETLDLDAQGEWRRFEVIAPRAIAVLDAVARDLDASPDAPTHELAAVLADLRADLVAGTRFALPRAA